MANPGQTRPKSLGPIPMENLFPKLKLVTEQPLDEEELGYEASVQAIIEDMRDFNETYLAPNREYSAALYSGEAPEPVEEGRSSIVLTEVRDLVLSVLPSLVRIFSSPSSPCFFLPRTEQDQAFAEEAQDYVSYVVQYDNPGFLIQNALLKDALIKGCGVAKWWTEEEVEVVEQAYRGLSLEQRQFVISQPDVEVVSEEQGRPLNLAPNVIQPSFDIVIQRTRKTPRHRVDAVPPEEFRISKEAKNVRTASACGHERIIPLSQLIAMGYKPEQIAEYLGAYSMPPGNGSAEAQQRNPALLDHYLGSDTGDPGVLYGEWFIRIDKDGDGVPELRKICTMGDGDTIVFDEAVSRAPFAIFCPDPEPHTAIGHSLAELVADLQLIKTNVLRNILDSLASTILPRTVVVDALANLQDVLNTELGAVIRAKDINAVKQLETQFVGHDALKVMEYMDLMGHRRTGVTEQSKGLDPKALQSTATQGVQMLVTGAQERIELIGRTLAETGFRDMYRGLLQEIVENPVPERVIRLRGNWTKVTPDQYDATMDVIVNPAIGKGSDTDRLQALLGVKATQEAIIAQYGPENPIVSPFEYRNTLADILEISGIRNTTRYFKQIDAAELQRQLQQAANKPDPNMVLAQAEADKVKAQVVKTLADARVSTEEMVLEDDRERDKLETETVLKAADISGKYGTQLDVAALRALQERERAQQQTAEGTSGGVAKEGPQQKPQAPQGPPQAPGGPPPSPPGLDLPQFQQGGPRGPSGPPPGLLGA